MQLKKEWTYKDGTKEQRFALTAEDKGKITSDPIKKDSTNSNNKFPLREMNVSIKGSNTEQTVVLTESQYNRLEVVKNACGGTLVGREFYCATYDSKLRKGCISVRVRMNDEEYAKTGFPQAEKKDKPQTSFAFPAQTPQSSQQKMSLFDRDDVKKHVEQCVALSNQFTEAFPYNELEISKEYVNWVTSGQADINEPYPDVGALKVLHKQITESINASK